MNENKMKSCQWVESPKTSNLMKEYHDEEWGTPIHNDQKLFEFLILEGAQAGLSWNTILNKRENYRKAFHNFDFKKIAKYNEKDFKRLMNNEGIVRNKLKIRSAIRNAKVFLEIIKEFGSFDKYIWKFVNNETIKNKFKSISELPAKTKISDEISKDLKEKGMNFVGSTIIYAFMQAIGMVNDHETTCFRYSQV